MEAGEQTIRSRGRGEEGGREDLVAEFIHSAPNPLDTVKHFSKRAMCRESDGTTFLHPYTTKLSTYCQAVDAHRTAPQSPQSRLKGGEDTRTMKMQRYETSQRERGQHPAMIQGP
ncbi:unnamed protein product [Pleuronectes platessa]|uniref:Uncharacterized protein n=1 Tax=Pleuronectes platessa TaxID=8262 RepID=A0A9N7YF29_PLEPL|nr:unnamed protein product [Pleuronectes platessa]